MRNRYKFTFISCFFIADLIAIIFGSFAFLRFFAPSSLNWNLTVLNIVTPIAILSWLLSISYFRLYHVGSLFNVETFFRNSWRSFILQRVLWQSSILLSQSDFFKTFTSFANLLQLSFLLVYFLLSRVLFVIILRQYKKRASLPYSVAIWGFNKTSVELASQLEANSCFIDFKGILNEDFSEDFGTKEKFSEALKEAIFEAANNQINELYIVAQPDFIRELNPFFELGDRHSLRLKFVPDFSPISKIHYSKNHMGNFHVIQPRHEPLQDVNNRFLKRVFDIVFSAIVILSILSWLYPLLAVLIKKQSKGPVLFQQLRTGKKNIPFWCYKFRSMYTNVDDESMQAQKGDSRITPIGQFLRRTSLDEMPQFFNVFIGNMSIVGPRPHMVQHTREYNEQIDNFMVRHFVKPGITGLAQVTGLRGETKKVSDMKRRVRADIQYLQHWSLMKDIKICFLTVILTLKGDEKAF